MATEEFIDATKAEATQMSLGMWLDETIRLVDSFSSIHLYVLIVGITVLASFLVLGTGNDSEFHTEMHHFSTTKQSKPNNNKTRQQLEPRWHLFGWFNFVTVGLFVWSVADFATNAQVYLNHSDSSILLKFLLGWSVLVCYFFSFFGISFVHDNMTDNVQQQSNEVDGKHYNAGIQSVSSASSKILHVPVCSTTSHVESSKPYVSIKSIPENIKELSDSDIVELVLSSQVKDHELENKLDPFRAVIIRRQVMEYNLGNLGLSGALQQLPYKHDLDFGKVHGANCEIVVGYIPIPVGLVGPITLNGQSVYIPMATTEGCLVASTNRGAKAISQGEGAYAVVTRDGITRAPCVRMESIREAAALKIWCEKSENFQTLKSAFESTTSFGKLISCRPTIAGKNVYIRLTCFAGDAMGMNMVSKGSLAVIEVLKAKFPSLELVAISGNMCTDKKAAAINWIEGRGKSVVVEATITKDVVRSTLKTTVKAIVETNLHKNLIGSAMAGTIGGFNAHASNIVTAVFIACGQDPAQNVESSNCITLMEEDKDGNLWISCTMPSIEVGTVGGGTSLPAQSACLDAMGCRGSGAQPGMNAQKLSMIVAAATMAGELSLLAALAANTLVAAHMQHNRKPQQQQGSSK